MAGPPRLDALTGLRFLAAAGVAFAHMPHLQLDPELSPTLKRLALEGGVGVSFFFILSGFVLAYTYHARLATPSRAELFRYYLARVGRVWPVHLLAFALAAAAMAASTPIGPGGGGIGPAVANIFLVHAWLPVPGEYLESFNPVAWSLSIEAFFYLVLPLVLWSAARRPIGPLWLTLATLLVWTPVFFLVRYHTRHPSEWSLYVCGLCPLVRLGEFVIGVWLGLALVRSGSANGPARGGFLATALEAAAVGLLVMLLLLADGVHPYFRYHVYYTPALALIVALFARQRGLLSRLLASRPAVFLGELSFSFFMLHCVVFVTVNRLLGAGFAGTFAHTILLLLAAGVVSAVVCRLFELPLRGWIVRQATANRGQTVLPINPPEAGRMVASVR